MKRTLIAIAAVTLTATAMTACQKTPPEQTAQADTAAIPVPSDGYSTGARVTVPEMKPTGDMTTAVDPNKPTKTTPGAAPQMAPTGNEREPYKPQPNGT